MLYLSKVGRRLFHRIFIIPTILMVCLSVTGNFGVNGPIAAAKGSQNHFNLGNCSAPSDPTPASLLVVLLDRSGSLVAQPGATDPDGYSTSVTKALADLWPGEMAVIPFSNDKVSVLGPVNLSDRVQQEQLKAKVESYPIAGDTPLAPAIRAVLNLLNQKKPPAGSRIILITDGNPSGSGNNDGAHQEQDIRQNLLPQFCQQGTPISAFGLTIANTPGGQDASQLLSAIAESTDGVYINVASPQELAQVVIRLYANWQHLTFTPLLPSQNGNYHVAIDTFAQKALIISFRSNSRYAVNLIGVDGQPVKAVVSSSDPHYVIENLTIAGILPAGTYIVNTGGDPNSQVYALVDSQLQLQLLQPTSKTVAYTNQPVIVQAQFIANTESIIPRINAAQVLAKVTLIVNGSLTSINTIELSQQKTASGTLSPIFSGSTLPYKQVGELQVEVLGVYQQAQRQTSVSLQLQHPSPTVLTPESIYPISLVIGILGILVLLVLLIIFILLIRHSQPKPDGYITNGRHDGDVALNSFSKSIIRSRDLEVRGFFNFSSDFELVFTKDKQVKIRTQADDVAVDVKGKTRLEKVTSEGVLLEPGQRIYMNGRKVASFEMWPDRVW